MDIRKLQRAIVDGLEDVKAQNIRVFNTEHLSPLFERVIVASGVSNRQTKALAASVRDSVKAGGMPVLRTEGEGNGEWVIVDCGAAVVHIMQPDIRDYYHLEDIWGDKPVKMKLDTTAKGLPKAASAQSAAPAKTTSKKTAAKKVVAKKAVAKKAGAPTAAPKSAVSNKPTTKPKTKPVAPRKSATSKVPASRATARKAPATREPTQASVSRTVGVKKVPAQRAAKPVAKKPVAKKAAPARRK
jgi:ribosome-associated protein